MHRRDVLKLAAATMAATLQPALATASTEPDVEPNSSGKESIEQWGIFELALSGTHDDYLTTGGYDRFGD